MRPKKLGTVTTVDAETGEVLEVRRNAMTLLPPAGDVCQECAVDHPFDQPHNQQSLYYQMRFYSTHGRYPTWTDSMSHCPAAVKAAWRAKLVEVMRANGLPVPDDLQGPEGQGGGR